MSEYGKTWWGKRWLRTLEPLGLSYPDSRIVRARSLARNDAVDDLLVEPGSITAWVDLPRRTFGVTVRVPAFDGPRWTALCAELSTELRNLAALLDDRLPEGGALPLFPGDGELSTECPCTDRTPVCVHVIAVQHAFATRFDDDPWLLLTLRGGDAGELVRGIRDARAKAAGARDVEAERVPMRELAVAGFYDSPGTA